MPAAPERGGAGFEPAVQVLGGREILCLRFARLSHAGLLRAFEEAGQAIRSRPPHSVRVLTVLEAYFNSADVEALKRYALANRPHVLASAVVARGFWAVIVSSLQIEGREDLRLFDSETAALEWLASVDG